MAGSPSQWSRSLLLEHHQNTNEAEPQTGKAA